MVYNSLYNSLGFPSPNTLRTWYKELEETGMLEGEISAERITHNNRTGLIRMVDYDLKRVPYFDSRQYFSSSRVKDIETSSTYS